MDIRLPMGIMFVLLGGMLSIAGGLASPESYSMALGINLDLWWGLLILLFGAVMVVLAVLHSRRTS